MSLIQTIASACLYCTGAAETLVANVIKQALFMALQANAVLL
jgi:hypothetical protein